MLSVRETEKYLQRVGYNGGVTPSLGNLQKLMTCHLRSVPYETVTIHRSGQTPSLAVADLFAKIVEGKGGGYCFEQNTLFQALLECLGYTVRPCFCRSTDTPGQVDPINHRGVLVTLDGKQYLADVGWGGPMAQGPLLPAQSFVIRLWRTSLGRMVTLPSLTVRSPSWKTGGKRYGSFPLRKWMPC